MKPIEQLLELMARLRDKEKGCPWDVAQNFASIAPHTLEEAYEVVDAIERKDMQGLREELGDLLLQVVFYAQMANEQGSFDFDAVVKGICDKLVNRHPHVFGDAKIGSAAEQSEAWEKHKEKEKTLAGFNPNDDILAGVATTLPAMTRAVKLQKRAARVGFDWPDVSLIFDKLQEEVGELNHVLACDGPKEAILEEVGDMIFTCVNIARFLDVDPEEAVRYCNRKFETRLHYMQSELNLQRQNIKDSSFQELNDLWDQAKIAEHTDGKDEDA
ncbi:MAG TPA: nucleoside triphosphate pyrophosphohydrolase [Rickettsiales bacterium]|nr:nucleoside triphosphate pyrophosphohydrolase [Rickettsiales bacterium]